MSSNQLSSFIKRERKIFRSPKQGLIPDSILDNLLSEAEAILEQELAQSFPNQAVGGIRLGYQIEQPDYSVESYWVGFGEHALYEKLLKFTELPADQEANEQDSASIPSASGGLSDELMNNLTNYIEDVIRSQIPAEMDKKDVHAWIFAHTVGYLHPLPSLLKLPNLAFVFSPDQSVLATRSVAGITGNCCRDKGLRQGVNGRCRSISCRP